MSLPATPTDSVGVYLPAIGRIPLLSAVQEWDLGHLGQAAQHTPHQAQRCGLVWLSVQLRGCDVTGDIERDEMHEISASRRSASALIDVDTGADGCP
jgi:hypothetical protein